MDGLRLLVTGKTRSGKSTSIHRLLSSVLRSTWSDVLLLDGKGSELSYYAKVPRVIYCAPDQLEDWADHLERLSTRLAERYADLTGRGLRSAADGDPRALIVIDEVQKGTRDQKFGKVIKAALTLIAEQSGALDDVLVIATQREQNSVPPNVRENCNAKLRMLGHGYFNLAIDGRPTRSGRVDNLSPDQAIDIIRNDPLIQKQLCLDNLHEILGSGETKPHRAPATLYMGEQGSGKTYAILNHPNGHLRHIYADCSIPHRQMLLGIIEGADASAPGKASIPELVDIAALALAASPTLLQIDNLDAASEKTRPTVCKLMDAATDIALAGNTPHTPAQQRKLDPFIARCEIVRLEPLCKQAARDLAVQHLPEELADRAATERRILDLSNGHPATIVNLSKRTQDGTLRELRTFHAPHRKVGLAWLLVVPLMAMMIVTRWFQPEDSYWLSLILLAISIILRPLFYRSMRNIKR